MSKITETIGRIRGATAEKRLLGRRQVFALALALALALVIWTPAMLTGVGNITPAEPDHDGVASAASGDKEWKFNAGGTVNSPPTVVDGTVYFSGGGSVYAVDTATGDLEWEFTEAGTNGAVNIADGTLYYASGSGELYALDPSTGDKLWNTTVGSSQTSPTVANGVVYVGSTNNNTYAIDGDTGAVNWKFDTGDSIDFGMSPTIDDGTVYIGNEGGDFHALDADTGAQEWSYSIGNRIRGSPTVGDGKVYFGAHDQKVHALDKSTGSLEWTYTAASYIVGAMTYYEGTVYGGSRGNYLYSLDATDGSRNWRYNTGDFIKHGPTVTGDTAYVGSINTDSALYAVDTSTGSLKWSSNVGDDIRESAPTVYDGTAYVGSADNYLYAIDTGVSDEKSIGHRVLYGTVGHTDDFSADGTASLATEATSTTEPGTKQSIGLVEDDLEMFPPGDTELVVTRRTSDYYPLWEVAGYSVEEWRQEAWIEEERSSFNWANKTKVSLEDGEYYRLELHSPYGTWEDSGFQYDASEYAGSTIWLEPDTGHLDDNGDGTAGGSISEGTNGPGSGDSGGGDDGSADDEDQGFGPTALSSCSTLDGQDGVEVEYWDPGYETWELEANLTADGSKTYHVHKEFDDARGYYRGCLGDSVTDNSSDDRRDLSWNHTARNATGAIISDGSMSYDPPVFGPTGNAPDSTGERVGLLAGVLGALGVLWFGGQRYIPASSVAAWPSESISPAFGIGAPIVAVLGLDLAGGGVVSASVATGLAQIAPFAGIVGVTVGGYAVLRWIRAPPS